MATLETNPKVLNLTDYQDALNREVSAADIAWLSEQAPFVLIEHDREERPIQAKQLEDDCNDPARGYPFIMPTVNGWQLEYFPRFASTRSHAQLTGSWSAMLFKEEPVEAGGMGFTLPERFSAVLQMINFCKMQGWQAVKISDGTDFMKWAVWAYCDYLELPVTGYEASDFDGMRQKNVASAMEAASRAFIQPYTPSFVRGGVASSDASSSDGTDQEDQT